MSTRTALVRTQVILIRVAVVDSGFPAAATKLITCLQYDYTNDL